MRKGMREGWRVKKEGERKGGGDGWGTERGKEDGNPSEAG